MGKRKEKQVPDREEERMRLLQWKHRKRKRMQSSQLNELQEVRKDIQGIVRDYDLQETLRRYF